MWFDLNRPLSHVICYLVSYMIIIFTCRIFKQQDPEQYLVLFEKETSVPFVGKGSMKIICGSVSVNGFKMDRDSGWRAIYSASFNHLVRLSVQLPIGDEVQEEVVNDISQRVEDQDRAELEAFLENRGSFSAFLLQHLDCIAWEFAGQMQTFSELMNDVQYESVKTFNRLFVFLFS